MLVGHTKFSPDWCFGLLKQRYRRCVVNCLDDLVGVVESSANVNTVQLVGDQEGETRVPTYDWCGYFKPHFKKLNNITKYHHFKFTSTEKGVSVKQLADAKEINITILKSPSHHFSTSTLPDIVTPPGLSDERKVYLYEKNSWVCRRWSQRHCLSKTIMPSNMPSNSYSTRYIDRTTSWRTT